MPGTKITDKQYEIYMENKNLGLNQRISAAKAGFCERSGRNLEKLGCKPSQRSKKKGSSRKDPLEGVWNTVLVPLLEKNPHLNCRTLLEYIQDMYPGQYPDSVLRTMQKRVKHWRGLCGTEKEIMFRQIHEPGRQSLSDFTHLKGVVITVQGKVFNHILYHFRLAYSNWSSMKIIHGGESFTALATGMQDALWKLGGCTEEHRTDSLSAAYKNLTDAESEDITKSYEDLCTHYGMKATRNNKGLAHENGSVESAHGHLKRRIEQALMIRGSEDFSAASEYQDFINKVVNRYNQTHHVQIAVERAALKELPQFRTVDFTETVVRVTTSSTISVKKIAYSVPSSLIGHQLRVRIYDERLSCYLNADHALDLDRVRVTKDMAIAKDAKIRCINYRHLIHSLARKPGAFRYSVLRNEILPNEIYRKIWKTIDARCTERHASKLMVGILKIAADYDCETKLGDQITAMLEKGQTPCLGTLDNMYKSKYVSMGGGADAGVGIARIVGNESCGTKIGRSDANHNIESDLLEAVSTAEAEVIVIPLISAMQHSLASYNVLLTFAVIPNASASVGADANVEVCHDKY